jgi:peptidyl-dipeptidase A
MKNPEAEARAFIEAHVEQVRPLAIESNLAGWDAATTGSEETIRRSAEARAALKGLYSSRDDFRRVREFLSTPGITDPLIRRQLELLDQHYTENQLSPDTIADLTFRAAELEGIFYNFRAAWEGAEHSNNELRELLSQEKDNARRQGIWEASKGIGPLIAPRLIELVRRRNEAARELGFDNYYSMHLELQEIDETELFDLLEDFRRRSDAAYRELRDRLDEVLSARYGVPVQNLRSWHWDDFFSQEAPAVPTVDLDPVFEKVEQESFARAYFSEIGLPVDDVLARSDLYERKGKEQAAFCTDIDREGDVRILCNLRPNERWMRTLLHELGHAVYDKFLPRELPFLLRAPAHTLSTESIAMYFGRLTGDPDWLRARLIPDLDSGVEDEILEQQRLSMLVAARWMLVMAHFERALYRDPQRPDLNQLWWDLVEDLQLIRRPEGRDQPDWASKMHLSLAPVYYHNYLLGELMASQLTWAMRASGPSVGDFLTSRIFRHGSILRWNELLRVATGEALSARHFVEQYVAEPAAG